MARRSFAGRLLRRLLLLCVLILAGWLVWEAVTWPDVKALATRPPATTAFTEQYKERERAAGRTPKVSIRWTPYAAIAPEVKRAVLVAEDINFFSHHGFDWGQIRIAVEEALHDSEAPRGASTITQQLAKNLWLSPSRNPIRKIKEAVLTWQLEKALTKRRILELYLNVAEFGPGIYGAEAASRHYFHKPAADLTDAEAALLAAALPRPGVWHPGVVTPAYRRYTEDVGRRMERIPIPARQLQ